MAQKVAQTSVLAGWAKVAKLVFCVYMLQLAAFTFSFHVIKSAANANKHVDIFTSDNLNVDNKPTKTCSKTVQLSKCF